MSLLLQRDRNRPTKGKRRRERGRRSQRSTYGWPRGWVSTGAEVYILKCYRATELSGCVVVTEREARQGETEPLFRDQINH